jgi:hypothetical protein
MGRQSLRRGDATEPKCPMRQKANVLDPSNGNQTGIESYVTIVTQAKAQIAPILDRTLVTVLKNRRAASQDFAAGSLLIAAHLRRRATP